MTQMYGKFALILALVGLLISLVKAQAGEPIPVLLNTQNEAQRQAWQDDLTAAFDDQTLIWVEDEKDADIVITYDNDTTSLLVRQNAVQRLSPILEPAPYVVLENDADTAAIAALLWPLAHGNCSVSWLDRGLLNLIGDGVGMLYLANCHLIDLYANAETEPEMQYRALVSHKFMEVISFPAAEVNWIWLWLRVSDVPPTDIILQPERSPAFWYGKRAQFYALDFDYQAALRDLDRAIEADPENPLYLTLKGEVYLLLYEWNNAKAAFDAALLLDPAYALAYFQRGILRSTMTETDAANADFSMYLSLAPRGVYAEMARQYRGEE